MSLGGGEILVVLVIALIVFGPSRLPEIGRQIGGAMRELRKVQDTVKAEIAGVMDAPIEGTPTPAPSVEPITAETSGTQSPAATAPPTSPEGAPNSDSAGDTGSFI